MIQLKKQNPDKLSENTMTLSTRKLCAQTNKGSEVYKQKKENKEKKKPLLLKKKIKKKKRHGEKNNSKLGT